MRILIIHEVSYLKKVVYEYQDLAERLVSRGHSVTVMDFDDSGDGKGTSHKVSRTQLAPVFLQETPFINLPVLKYFSGRENFRRALKKKLEDESFDLIFLYSVFINGTETIKLAERFCVPVIYRVLDVYHQVRQNPWIKWPLYFLEKKIYRNAPYIALTNTKMKTYVDRMAFPKKPGSMHVIQHGVDTEYFKPSLKSKDRLAELGLDEHSKIALFLGTLYPFSGLDKIITQLAKNSEKSNGLKIVIVGDGEQRGFLESIVKRYHMEDSVFLVGSRPYSEVPSWISIADVTFTSFEINEITKDIVPIKILQYLSAGKATVCAPIPDVVKLMPSERSGVVYCDIADKEGEPFFLDLLRITMDPDLSVRLSKKARDFALSELSISKTMDSLEALFLKAVLASKFKIQNGAKGHA